MQCFPDTHLPALLALLADADLLLRPAPCTAAPKDVQVGFARGLP
jgi:hypothetical protein